MRELLNGPVIVEEKVDGSQISFGMIDGELHIRSKGAEIHTDAPDKMFAAGVDEIKLVCSDLIPNATYRGEYLKSPRHNVLKYDRVPEKHIAIFDIELDDGDFVRPNDKPRCATAMGFECVPMLAEGKVTQDRLEELLGFPSFLGGTTVEGLVIKPTGYNLYGQDHKVLMAKLVAAAFREAHKHVKYGQPGKGDVIERIAARYRTDARWQKAVQHLRDDGKIAGEPRDIGLLIREVQDDLVKECADEIAAELLGEFLPHIKRKVIVGFPEWYLDRL